MNPKKLVALFWLFGASTGLLIGSTLGPDFSIVIAKVVLILGVIFLVFLWRRIERPTHLRNVESWGEYRIKGRWYFIVTQYVVLRGSFMLVTMIAPGFIISGIPVTDLRYSGMVLVLFAIVTIILGHSEWTDCEREYQARITRESGSLARATSARRN